MNYILSIIIGYLLGSIPTAYLVLKKTHSINITESGTGNVGAMNSFEVTNSKIIGILVFVIDALKGLLSAYLVILILPVDFTFPALSLLFAVFSHCFNPWLKFKGGRGLATAAGGAALISPLILFSWGILWVIIYFFKKDILIANVGAIILTLLLTLVTFEIFFKYTYPTPGNMGLLIMFSASLLLIIFIKHIDPLKKIINKQNDSIQR
ncbi:MAG TPA: glycerol-3-phosphate acyltransferase [Ignavibacteriaceae bacterium]|nr:glycerol-3-phosphate acyltransferase [Ignavibacteriaceae bacterium]